mgnify:CR=1 FL=1
MNFNLNTRALAITSVVAFALCIVACTEAPEQNVTDSSQTDSLPFMRTLGVSTVISDSGIVKYKMISEEWLYYQDDSTHTYTWKFEKGLFFEKFDNQYNVEAFINCDTAYYYSNQQLWELRNRVVMRNVKGETFKTSILYWNQATHTIYSPAFMVIDGIDQDLQGYDFSSNEQMTEYIIHQSSGAFPMGEDRMDAPKPSDDEAERLEQE